MSGRLQRIQYEAYGSDYMFQRTPQYYRIP